MNRVPARTVDLVPALLAATAAVLSLAACGAPLPADADSRPATLLLAVDGLHWEDLLPAMRAGTAPGLLDLCRRGGAYRLAPGAFIDGEARWKALASGSAQPDAPAGAPWDLLQGAGVRVEVIPSQDAAAVDHDLQRLRRSLPPDTDVIVVSDGLLIAAGPSIRAHKPRFTAAWTPRDIPQAGAAERAGVLDLLPTLLALRGVEIPTTAEGEVLAEVLVEAGG